MKRNASAGHLAKMGGAGDVTKTSSECKSSRMKKRGEIPLEEKAANVAVPRQRRESGKEKEY